MRDLIEEMAGGASTAQRPAIDFEAAFGALPSPYMVLDGDLRYVEANAAYCRTVERTRDELIGRGLFELFPNSGPEGDRLRASLQRVLDTGAIDSIPLIPYPIALPLSRGGGVEMRYWSAVHVPVASADGMTRFVMQNTVDVTELQKLKALAYGPGAEPAPGEKDIFQRTREVEALNRGLIEETQGLRDLFMQAPGFIAVLLGESLTFGLVNNAYMQLIGHRQLIGKTLVEALPEVRDQGFEELLRQVMAEREPFIGEGVSVRLQRRPGAALEERFVDFIYQPLVRPNGEVWGVFVQGSDVTDRIRGEQQRQLLLDELNHRVKNTLATVQAIAAQTLRSTPEPLDFKAAFESRLLSLSATHELLTAAGWRSASLSDVLKAEFRPYDLGRYALDGPEVALGPAEALAVALMVHELTTNAAKYGALSSSEGCVTVRWTVGGGALDLKWSEAGGPPVRAPSRRGFGSRLIERSLQGALDGRVDLKFPQTGVECEVRLPLRELTSGDRLIGA